MTTDLRTKLIQKGWVTEFNADTLTRLIEEHYAALADGPAVPEGREPVAVAMHLTEPGAEGPSAEALANFTAWFCRNYPGPDTLIHRPEWHAPKVFRAAAAAIARWGNPAPQPEAK